MTPLRVLLVEDDEGDAFLVRELLDDVPLPVELVHVRSVAEAQLELSSGFGCVLLDLGLPDLSGLLALGAVLASAGTAAVVCLTGSDDDVRGAAAVASGAQDYLVKGSVDGPALHRALRYAVERQRADAQARQLVATGLRAAENARLERGLLPSPVVRDPRISVTVRYQPGRGSLLGGDFFDVVETADGTLLVVIGDVAGHGPDEAALGVCLRIAWRTLVLAGTPVDRLLPVVEEVLVHERHSEEVFTTICMLVVDADRRRARLWNGGHPAPLLLGTRGRSLEAQENDPALGIAPGEVSWSSRPVELPAPWRVLLFTDGLVEGHVGRGSDRLGAEALAGVLAESDRDRPADGVLLDRVLATVSARNGGPLTDDVAAVVLACGLPVDRIGAGPR